MIFLKRTLQSRNAQNQEVLKQYISRVDGTYARVRISVLHVCDTLLETQLLIKLS